VRKGEENVVAVQLRDRGNLPEIATYIEDMSRQA
jgi:hypothetical protein